MSDYNDNEGYTDPIQIPTKAISWGITMTDVTIDQSYTSNEIGFPFVPDDDPNTVWVDCYFMLGDTQHFFQRSFASLATDIAKFNDIMNYVGEYEKRLALPYYQLLSSALASLKCPPERVVKTGDMLILSPDSCDADCGRLVEVVGFDQALVNKDWLPGIQSELAMYKVTHLNTAIAAYDVLNDHLKLPHLRATSGYVSANEFELLLSKADRRHIGQKAVYRALAEYHEKAAFLLGRKFQNMQVLNKNLVKETLASMKHDLVKLLKQKSVGYQRSAKHPMGAVEVQHFFKRVLKRKYGLDEWKHDKLKLSDNAMGKLFGTGFGSKVIGEVGNQSEIGIDDPEFVYHNGDMIFRGHFYSIDLQSGLMKGSAAEKRGIAKAKQKRKREQKKREEKEREEKKREEEMQNDNQ